MVKKVSNSSQVTKRSQNYNLKFLDIFLKKMGWSIPEFASKIGMTKAAVYHWFKEDSMFLTTLHNALEKIGYEVIFSMKMPNREENINIEIDDRDMRERDKKPKKKLDFYHDALYNNDIDQHKLAKYLGRDVETIDYWFRHDNCQLHYIFKTAKYTGMKLKIDIKPVKQEDL